MSQDQPKTVEQAIELLADYTFHRGQDEWNRLVDDATRLISPLLSPPSSATANKITEIKLGRCNTALLIESVPASQQETDLEIARKIVAEWPEKLWGHSEDIADMIAFGLAPARSAAAANEARLKWLQFFTTDESSGVKYHMPTRQWMYQKVDTGSWFPVACLNAAIDLKLKELEGK